MTKNEARERAREIVGAWEDRAATVLGHRIVPPVFELRAAFASAILAVVEEEKERCAKIAENVGHKQDAAGSWTVAGAPFAIAAAIREPAHGGKE